MGEGQDGGANISDMHANRFTPTSILPSRGRRRFFVGFEPTNYEATGLQPVVVHSLRRQTSKKLFGVKQSLVVCP